MSAGLRPADSLNHAPNRFGNPIPIQTARITLEAQEGRLFKPLAYTKTFAMAAAALLSVTLVPALMVLFVRGRIVPEHRNPLNRLLIWIYRPIIRGVLKPRL